MKHFYITIDNISEKNGFQPKDQIFSFHLTPYVSKPIDIIQQIADAAQKGL